MSWPLHDNLVVVKTDARDAVSTLHEGAGRVCRAAKLAANWRQGSWIAGSGCDHRTASWQRLDDSGGASESLVSPAAEPDEGLPGSRLAAHLWHQTQIASLTELLGAVKLS